MTQKFFDNVKELVKNISQQSRISASHEDSSSDNVEDVAGIRGE